MNETRSWTSSSIILLPGYNSYYLLVSTQVTANTLISVMAPVVKVKMLPFPGTCAFKQGLKDPIDFKTQINVALMMDEISDNIS